MIQPNTIQYGDHTVKYFSEGKLKFVALSLVPILGDEWAAQHEVAPGTLLAFNEIVGDSDAVFGFRDWARETFGNDDLS